MKFENLTKELKKIKSLLCPNCNRVMPNANFRRKHGCFWCVPIKSTKYCNGKYI